MAPRTAVMDRSAEVRGYRYKNWNTTAKTVVNKVGNGLYWVQSGVFLTKFGHRLLISLSAQPDNV